MWRILEWSRELGRGAITSPHFARIAFDAACADVDDFTLGELVHVELEGDEATMCVRRIWPDLPRFQERSDGRAAPALDDALRTEAEAAVAEASRWIDANVRFMPGCVRIELDDDAFAYGPSATLDAFDPTYVELPARISVRFVRLADSPARGYLASRCDLSASDIAIAIIDDEGRFYFVVTNRLSFTRAIRSR